MIAKQEPTVAIDLRILDEKTGFVKEDSGIMNVQHFMKQGSSVIPVGIKLPLERLGHGKYIAEFKAFDSAGKVVLRSKDFDVE